MKEEQLELIHKEREKLDDIKDWLKVKEQKEEEKNKLEAELDQQRADFDFDFATVAKEKAAAIDKLRKEMLMNIRNVKI